MKAGPWRWLPWQNPQERTALEEQKANCSCCTSTWASHMLSLGAEQPTQAMDRGCLTALARIRLCYKAAWERSPLPGGGGELGNIHYKTFESSLIYEHFAPQELGTSQTLCSHQGSVSTALLGKHWSPGCQVLTSIAVHGAITDSSENLHFL